MFFLVEQHLGEAFGKFVEEAPVGGRFLAVEQAGLGHPEHPSGFAANRAAGSVAFAQPAEYLGVALAEGVEVVPEGRQDDDIGAVQGAIHRHAHIAEAVNWQTVRADQVDLEGRRQAHTLLFAIAQAGHMEEVLGLHQGRGEYAIGGENADAAQGCSWLNRHGYCSYKG